MASRGLSLIAPVRLRGKVVRGFGRGSKELGFPTANIEIRGAKEMELSSSAVFIGISMLFSGFGCFLMVKRGLE